MQYNLFLNEIVIMKKKIDCVIFRVKYAMHERNSNDTLDFLAIYLSIARKILCAFPCNLVKKKSICTICHLTSNSESTCCKNNEIMFKPSQNV